MESRVTCSYDNVVVALQQRAVEAPEQVAFRFLNNGEDESASWTYAELHRRAQALGAFLQRIGAADERVLLLFPPGLDFVGAFFGCLYAGAVAVPTSPPRRRGAERLDAIAADARPRFVLTLESALPPEGARQGMQWIAADELSLEPAEDWKPPRIGPNSLAFLQYTSGSTSLPKGVEVTHGNLAHNEELIRRAFRQDESSVVVGWLPLYHDMGLIGNVLQPLWVGGSCVLMPPTAFLQKPLRWLAAISRYRGTTSGGPNFAYDLCARRIGEEERAGLDLTSWTLAFNGSEPVRAETLNRFAAAFASCGFRREAFFPCYGLAEATLMATGDWDCGQAAGSPPRVSCGPAGDGVRMAVVEPESGILRPEGEVGEVWLASPSVARGYWQRPEETERTFRAYLASGEGPFLRTGDLGFLDGDRLFVTGRLKDLVIIRGRNHYPQDIELTAESSHPAVRAHAAAAFSMEAEGEERLALVVELERTFRGDPAEVAAALRVAVAREHELEIFDLTLVTLGGVPRTTSGKIRRRACRELLLAGELAVIWRDRAAAASAPAAFGPPSREELLALGAEARRERLEEWLRGLAAAALRLDPAALAGPGRLALDSLAVVALQARIEAALRLSVPLETLFETPDVLTLAAELAALLESGVEEGEALLPAPAPSAEPSLDYPASEGQRALWYLHRLSPESAAYNIAVAVRLPEGTRAERLRELFPGLVARHRALGAVFVEEDGRLMVHERPDTPVPINETDAAGMSAGELSARLREEARRPFDLEHGPLLRLALFTGVPGGGPVLLLAVHHAVADFESLAVLAQDLGQLWAGAPLSGEPAYGYADFAAWQLRWLESPAGERAWDFWRRTLAGTPQLDLPTDRPRPPVQTDRGAAVRLRLSGEVVPGIGELAGRTGATTSMVLQAAVDALLARLSGQSDFPVGFVVSGRRPELAGLVGYCANTLVLRSRTGSGLGTLALLTEVRQTLIGALEHQAYPFVRLAERLQPERDPSRSPLFQVLVNVVRPAAGAEALGGFALEEPGARISWGGLTLESHPLETGTAQMDLALTLAPVEDGLGAALRFNTDLFDRATAERWLGAFGRLLAGMVSEPERPVAGLPLLSTADAEQVVREWGTGPVVEPAAEGLFELFATRAAERPAATALVHGEESVTYRELADRALELAARLRVLGVDREVPVGVCLRRTPDLIAALLGTLAAGGAYVPLDLAYPARRTEMVLADSAAPVLVTEPLYAERFAGLPLRLVLAGDRAMVPSGFRPQPADPDQLAYVIYTSGSTGRPKGVAIRHGSAVARCKWAAAAYAREEMAGVLAATSVCFDLSVFEIFATLGRGGTVILAPDALALAELPARRQVTLVNTVPSALAALLAADALPEQVRVVNLAGEPLPRRLVEPVLAGHPGRRLLNLYGPSEDTTYSTGREIARGEAGAPGIGRPLPGTRALVLDSEGEPVLPGLPGELHLGGAGLARGYFRRPDLAAERFVPDPFTSEPGARLFRTGDLVRHRADGDLEFLGRRDHQVKIRGFRIELGEVEAALETHPAVAEAVVVAREDAPGERRLVAYAGQRAGTAVTPEDLRAHLAARLPEPMIPASAADLVLLPALPRTPNGKVDRAALPVPGKARGAAAYAAPATPLERELAGLWSELLGVSEVGRDDGFFALGGHSLLGLRLVARVREQLGVSLPLVALLRSPTVAGLAREIDAASGAPGDVGLPLVRGEAVEAPLSFAQERLWFLDRLEPGSPVYNVPLAVRLRGPLAVPALAAVAAPLAARHEVLRTVFVENGPYPLQRIQPEGGADTGVADLAGLAPEVRETELRRLLRDLAVLPFSLETGPVFRSHLVRLGSDEHVWLIVVHHIAFDGWSIEILLRDAAELYAAALEGRPATLPPLPVRYADHAAAQRRQEVDGAGLAFWRDRLAGIPVLQLPTDRPRPASPSLRGGVGRVELAAADVARLREAAAAEGASLFTALLASFRLWLQRVTGQPDVGIGSPLANRGRAELQGVIGLFAGMLVLRTEVPAAGSFLDLLRRERDRALDAWARQDVPFERIVEQLAPQRDLGHHPLFQASFTLQPEPALPSLPGLRAAFEQVHTGTSKFDLSLLLWERSDGRVEGELEYRADLFDAATVQRAAGHLNQLAAAVAAHPVALLETLPLLSAAERHQLLYEWNDTDSPAVDAVAGVHELVARHAALAPEALAVVAPEGTLTYRELLDRADALARRLRALGAGPESVVAVCLERSLDLVASLLGVLRAGAAYVPLDLGWPEERLAALLREASPKAVIVRGTPAWLDGEVPCLDPTAVPGGAAEEDLPVAVAPDGLAYVIYTSGSTGRPKGIGISHASLLELVAWHRRAYGLSPAARATQIASPAFDASVWEIWPYLASGGALVLLDEESRWAPRRLIERLAAAGITHSFVPTPLAELALAEPWPAGMALRFLLTGGDRLHARPAADLPFALVNHYGPTECTVVTTCSRVQPGSAAAPPPIGRPIDGLRVYVLDRQGAPAPVGAPGELWIGGQQIARGYVSNPQMTAERFTPDPFAPAGSRIYRTGDLVRWRTDGEIDFLGRLDQQVKVRGFRIELGDVETALLACPGVREAAVTVWSPRGGDARLAAYAALEPDTETTAADLRDQLRRSLPDYMVPAVVELLPALPLTASGKVDRAALPAPALDGETMVEPRNEIEEELALLWCEVLDRERVSVEDDFFRLGGHSLQVAQLTSRVRESFGVELPVRALFEAPTVAALSVRVVEELARQAGDEALSVLWDELEGLERPQVSSS